MCMWYLTAQSALRRHLCAAPRSKIPTLISCYTNGELALLNNRARHYPPGQLTSMGHFNNILSLLHPPHIYRKQRDPSARDINMGLLQTPSSPPLPPLSIGSTETRGPESVPNHSHNPHSATHTHSAWWREGSTPLPSPAILRECW